MKESEIQRNAAIAKLKLAHHLLNEARTNLNMVAEIIETTIRLTLKDNVTTVTSVTTVTK